MPEKKQGQVILMSEQQMKTMPILAMRDVCVLPGMLVHLDVSREITKRAIEEAMAEDGSIFLTLQRDESIETPSFHDLYEIGVIAKIKQEVKVKDDVLRVMISTKERGNLLSLNQTKPFLKGEVVPYEWGDEELRPGALEKEAMCRNLKDVYTIYLNENPRASRSDLEKIQGMKDLGKLTDLIAMHINMGFDKRQEILECLDLELRYEMVAGILTNEVNLSRIREGYRRKVKEEVDKNQKEYFLREQMKVIRNELGDGASAEEYQEKYKEQLEQLSCSEEVYQKIAEEIKRLDAIPTSSSEHIVERTYIENLLALPWDKASIDRNDIVHAEQILEEDHYGLKKVKERILDYLAVRFLTKKGETPILCLVGPPGTGKTSIAKSIARALHKKYVRISLGGVRDEAEIRGHRKTYVGAMPGRIAEGIRQAGVKNPLMLLDEVDKVSSDYKGDTASALLEVLDGEQNVNFRDHYLEVPLDLSEVFFIATANDLTPIPKPLRDRMEIIELSSYTENEKFHIAENYLVKKQRKLSGLTKKQVSISDEVIREVIHFYTREAGVRNLERTIGQLMHKAARKIVEGEEKVDIKKKSLKELLGPAPFEDEDENLKPQIGVVRGLAWTSVGGDTLSIEVNVMPGKGKMELTGCMGDVMKESAQIGLSYVRSIAENYGIDSGYFEKHDIHLHIPEGAVPKDGPSAGITMALAILSAITGIPVRGDIAMTGEITLRGKVLPIGGLKEKLLAAKTVGVKEVLVPARNKRNVVELDEEITDGMKITYVEDMNEVIEHAMKK